MSFTERFGLRRALGYVALATAFTAVVGYFQQGSVAGGLLLGLAVGGGVAAGIVGYELSTSILE